MQSVPSPAGGRPTPAQLENLRRLTGPPDNEMPVSVAVNAVLARTPDLVVALSGGRVYRTGVELNVLLRLEGAAAAAVAGPPAGPGTAPGPWMGAQRPDSPDRWLIGVEYPDGRTASTLANTRLPGLVEHVVDERQPRLIVRGGSGSSRVYDARLWLAPLPPPGPLTIIFTWPAHDVLETVTQLDTDPWREAAEQATQLWPQSPATPAPTASRVPAIRLQPGGWFERSSRLPPPA